MYIGIDLGTSGVKALLIDADQQIIGSTDAALSVSRPHSGWSEQSPADWVDAADRAVSTLSSKHPAHMQGVRGIGLSGQMHGATLLGSDDKPLRPCILWNDTRSHAEAAELDADPNFRELSGNIVFPGFTAPKLVWVARNEPEKFERTAKVVLPKDYLRLWLTGEHVSEMSDAAGTSWLDTGGRRWSQTLLDKSGMSLGQMPRLIEGSEISGNLRGELSSKWGMGESVVVAGGAGDNAASAIGMGVLREGQAFVSLGTSGVLFAANDGFRPRPESAVHAFCHAVPDTWHQMGVILSATDSLQWLAEITGRDASQLTGELGEELVAPGETVFLPYLAGERTPHNDASVRGAMMGISHATGTVELTRAVLEGVAFALKDNLIALGKAGTRLDRVTAIGGGSRSAYWLKLIATVLGIPVDEPQAGEVGAAFGAARLGLIAAEGADPGEVAMPPVTARTHEPVSELADAFDAAYERFRNLYPAISDV